MEDLTRLIISHERIVNIKNNNLELTNDEAHYHMTSNLNQNPLHEFVNFQN